MRAHGSGLPVWLDSLLPALALSYAWGKLPLQVMPSGPFVTQSRGIRRALHGAGGLLRSKALAVEVRGGHPSFWLEV